jgi:Peptidase propeptide and YPEB domain
MRKSVGLGIGLASVAVLAVTGIASATMASGSGSATPLRQTAASSATVISQADAERIAQAAVPNSTATQSRLDTDNGRTVWNVHLFTPTGEVEVKVDAQTGEARVDDDQTGARPTATSDDDADADDAAAHDANDDHGNDGPGNGTHDDHGDNGPGHN